MVQEWYQVTAVETKKKTYKVSEPRHDDTHSKQAKQTRFPTCEKPVLAMKKHCLNSDTHSSNHLLKFTDTAQ